VNFFVHIVGGALIHPVHDICMVGQGPFWSPCFVQASSCSVLACRAFGSILCGLPAYALNHTNVFATQALRKLDFHPSQPFVMACASFLGTKLEGSIAGALAPSTLEVGTVSKLLSGLVGWKFPPPPPMLLMVCFRWETFCSYGLCS